jgi:hypothetical protein
MLIIHLHGFNIRLKWFKSLIFFFFFFWWYWSLSSGHTPYHFRHTLIPFCLVIFYAWENLDCDPPCYTSHVAGITDLPNHAQLLFVEMGDSWTFCLGWPWTVILPNSFFQVARIIGMSPYLALSFCFYITEKKKILFSLMFCLYRAVVNLPTFYMTGMISFVFNFITMI